MEGKTCNRRQNIFISSSYSLDVFLQSICLLALSPSEFWSALRLLEHLEDCQPLCTHTHLTWPGTLANCQSQSQIIRTSTIHTERGSFYCATTKISHDNLHITAKYWLSTGQMPQVSSKISGEHLVRKVLWCQDCECTYLSDPCRLDLSPKAE